MFFYLQVNVLTSVIKTYTRRPRITLCSPSLLQSNSPSVRLFASLSCTKIPICYSRTKSAVRCFVIVHFYTKS